MRLISVTKPGIIIGNLITLTGGSLLSLHQGFTLRAWLVSCLGMALVVASGCVFNNLIDVDIDSLMARTRDRVLVKGGISPKFIFIYGILLGLGGLIILGWALNLLSACIGFMGLFFYVVLYSLWLKRKPSWGLLVGGIAGSVPPLIGYAATMGNLSPRAWIFFLYLFLWQMPHFYAIAIYRLDDFKAASLPVLPIRKSLQYTQYAIMAYIGLLLLVLILSSLLRYFSFFYSVPALCLTLFWFIWGGLNWRKLSAERWAKKMFFYSILNITFLSFLLGLA